MVGEDEIKKVQDTLTPIVGDKLPEYCNELVEHLDEYSKEKGISKDSVLNIEDFMKWLEAKHYDWLSLV